VERRGDQEEQNQQDRARDHADVAGGDRGEEDKDDRRARDQAGGVELLGDVGLAQLP
jgi:hypothetical protein